MEESKKEAKDDWILDELKIEFKRFGENKGKYEGRIKFQNGLYESFCFNIKPEMAQNYLDLIAKDIIQSTISLSEDLKNSLGVIE